MPQSIIYLDEPHNLIIKKYSMQWGTTKHDTILKIIEEFNLLKEQKEDGVGSSN